MEIAVTTRKVRLVPREYSLVTQSNVFYCDKAHQPASVTDPRDKMICTICSNEMMHMGYATQIAGGRSEKI